jgi:hypothetical protein
MANIGGQLGNTNATKGRRWDQAIQRALAHRSRAKQIEALDELAEKLLELCEQGDIAALKELGDRLDGKPSQAVTVAGDSNAPPVAVKATVEFVRAAQVADPGST